MAFGPSGRGARLAGMFAYDEARKGRDEARGFINDGYNDAVNFTERAQGFLTPLYGQSMQGFNAYGDRAGINGAEGSARAMEGFRNSIFGQAGRDQAANDSLRRFANMGMLASGNSAYGLSNALQRNDVDNYSRYAALASPYLSIAPGIAGQLAGQQQGLGSLAMQRGQNLANITTNAATQMGSAGGAALAAGDGVRQQVTNLGMQGIGMGINLLSSLFGGMGGFGGGGGSGIASRTAMPGLY